MIGQLIGGLGGAAYGIYKGSQKMKHVMPIDDYIFGSLNPMKLNLLQRIWSLYKVGQNK